MATTTTSGGPGAGAGADVNPTVRRDVNANACVVDRALTSATRRLEAIDAEISSLDAESVNPKILAILSVRRLLDLFVQEQMQAGIYRAVQKKLKEKGQLAILKQFSLILLKRKKD